MLALLRNTFVSRDQLLWKRLYMTYVRPHLKYALVFWGPYIKAGMVIAAHKGWLPEEGTEVNKFYKTVKSAAIDHFFANRVVNNWNSLPDSVVDATQTNAFKKRLDEFQPRDYSSPLDWLGTSCSPISVNRSALN